MSPEKNKNNLNPPFGLEFGMNQKDLKNALKELNAEFFSSNSIKDKALVFYNINIADVELKNSHFYFIGNKLCKIKLEVYSYMHISKVIELYNQIKKEINAKYYISENDFVKFHPPAYDDDDFEDTHERNIQRGLIDYAVYWNFKTESEFDDYIILKINKGAEIELNYEHGTLNNEYLKAKKLEW